MNPSFLVPAVGNAVPELGATFATTSSSNVFLTPASLGLQAVTMTVLGQSVFLPPTYSIVPGQTKFSVKNNGIYPFGVRDSNGVLLIAITGGGYATFSLDNSTSWVYSGSNLEIGLTTIDNTFSSTFTSGIFAPFVALDNNTSIHFAQLSSGFSAFIVDNLGKVLTTPVTVSAAASSSPVQAFKITSNTAIVFYGESATTNRAVVLSVTGNSPSYTLTVNTPQTFATTLGSVWGGENFVSQPRISQLTSTLYVAQGEGGTGAFATTAVAVSVSGIAITIGAGASVLATNSLQNSSVTYPLTATTALSICTNNTTLKVSVCVLSIAGTTTTVNAAVTTVSSTTLTAAVASTSLSPTKALVLLDNNAGVQLNAVTITITGTTVALGTELTVETVATLQSSGLYVANSATRYNPHLWAIGGNIAGLWYLDSSGVSRVLTLSESGGILTAGTILFRSISTAATASTDGGTISPQGLTEFVAFKQEGAANAWKTRAISHKISGATITAGATYPLLEIPNTTKSTGSDLAVSRMSTGDYIPFSTALGGITAMLVFRSNGDVIAYRGKVTVPSLLGISVTTPAPGYPAAFPNRLVVLGNTSVEGTTVAIATLQLRILNVEIAQ